MPSGEQPRHELTDIREVISPLHVCPLVHHDAIELGSREASNQCRRYRDDWRATTNHGRCPHVV
jgi:hypothetical protein